MHGIISSDLIDKRHGLASRFKSGRPFPHLVIDSFFEESFCRKLIEAFPSFEAGSNIDEDGIQGAKSAFEDIRALGEVYTQADDLFRSSEFAELVSALTGIPDLLYDPKYIGGGTHENLSGQDLDPHVDFNYHPSQGWHRRLNLIVYLNPEWREEWGGSLDLYEDPWLDCESPRVRVVPIANRAVLFETSERSWHGFEKIRPPERRPKISRRSLAIYMYTKERPVDETAPPHSTVYVERPLPFTLRPGRSITFQEYEEVRRTLIRRQQHVERLQQNERMLGERTSSLMLRVLSSGAPLKPGDIASLRRSLDRQNDLLRNLYIREKEFSSDEVALMRSLAERPAFDLPVFGKPLSSLSIEGCYPDHWAGPCVRIELSAVAPVTEIALEGDLPDIYPRAQHLDCSVGGQVYSMDLTPGPFRWTLRVALEAGDHVQMCIQARETTVPLRDAPGSVDDRELAYRLLALELD